MEMIPGNWCPRQRIGKVTFFWTGKYVLCSENCACGHGLGPGGGVGKVGEDDGDSWKLWRHVRDHVIA
jgi:hypothetical protein